ncbi:MAG: tRNA ((37)-N6)-threonylcarbamoyltransferase complex transferase subunit TsaD [Pseudomonadota bacterium]|jgi:N6-L-threonylcarbamoyladenine synthase
MLTLAFESSCDETGVALWSAERGLIGHVLHSQIALHAAYGGVVPELAARDHLHRWVGLCDSLLQQTGLGYKDLEGLAYTRGPGLAGCLLVGATAAIGLAARLHLPVLGVHHLEGHLLSPLLADPAPSFPFVALLVSGGHTQLMDVAGIGEYQLLGDTLDDAAGEAFDKSAKLLGLPYPGGAMLASLAQTGDRQRIALPRPLMAELKRHGNLDFSFSGLKTAVALKAKNLAPADRPDLAAAVEAAIVEVLVAKSLAACARMGRRQLVVAGGVSANQYLRHLLTEQAKKNHITVFYPPLEYCTDNAAMIALAGGLRMPKEGQCDYRVDIRPRWPLAQLTQLKA